MPTVDIEKSAIQDFSNLTSADEKELSELSELTDGEESLPAWLQDNEPGVDLTKTSLGEIESVDRLQIEEATLEATPTDEEDDWQKLLRDLPPSQPVLTKAAIPDWLEALDPTLLDSTSETTPLSNLPEATEAVEIELVIARPRTSTSPIQTFTVTPEQQRQVDLLEQLVASKRRQEEDGVEREQLKSRFAAWIQPVLALLLIGVVLFGLLDQGDAFQEAADSIILTTVLQSLDLAAGKPVLVAFDYTPALAGELASQADMVLQRVAENGSPILTASQFGAGTAVARLATQPYSPIDLGYIPANAIGLRQLGDCMADAACITLNTRKLDPATAEQLNKVALIIILTGDRDSLVNWIEQVGSQQNVPLTAVTTRALAPVVAPYLGSGQLHALLSSQQATALPQQHAQQLAQLLIVILFIIGGLGYGLFKDWRKE